MGVHRALQMIRGATIRVLGSAHHGILDDEHVRGSAASRSVDKG
jgi:hypothetical protein